MLTTEKFNWTKFSMVRVYLVAAGRGNCELLIEQLPRTELDPILQEFRDSLEQNFSEDNRRIVELAQTLSSYPSGTLGFELNTFYQRSPFPRLGEPDAFPARYIFLHDAHHVLLNCDTSEQGELEVIAFEGGLIGCNTAEGILPVFSQVAAFAGMPGIDFVRIARAWEIGANARAGLLENWNIEPDLGRNLEAVRQRYNVSPLK